MSLQSGESSTHWFYESIITALLENIEQGALIMKPLKSSSLKTEDYEILYYNKQATQILLNNDLKIKYLSQIPLFSHNGLHKKLINATKSFCDHYKAPYNGGIREFDFCSNTINDITILTFKEIIPGKHLSLNLELLNAMFALPLAAIIYSEPIMNADNMISDFHIVLSNQKAKDLTGPRQNAGLKNALEPVLGHDTVSSIFEQIVYTFKNNKRYEFEFQHNASGKTKWCYLTVLKVFNGVLLVIRDITKNKQNEIELLEHKTKLEEKVKERTNELFISQEKFKLLALAINDAIYDWNLEKETLWWNEGFKNYFGYKDEELNQALHFWKSHIHPDEREKVLNDLNDTLKSGNDRWTCQYRFSKSDGSYANVFDKGYIIKDNNGKPVRMLGAMFDITELKKTEMELEKSNIALKKINQDMDNFIYTASHDLKAPVSNIEGLVNSLKETLPQDLFSNPEIASLFKMIEYSIDRFRNTLNNLSEITRAQKNIEEDGRKEVVDVSESIENVKASLGEKFIAPAKFILEISKAPRLQFSKANFESLLFNLISNAIKYRHPDRQPIITITTEWKDEFFVLTVKDNGLGLKEEDKNKLFSSFKRFHTNIEGTGVGLYVVKRIVESSSGKIEVESGEGKGSAFRLFLKES